MDSSAFPFERRSQFFETLPVLEEVREQVNKVLFARAIPPESNSGRRILQNAVEGVLSSLESTVVSKGIAVDHEHEQANSGAPSINRLPSKAQSQGTETDKALSAPSGIKEKEKLDNARSIQPEEVQPSSLAELNGDHDEVSKQLITRTCDATNLTRDNCPMPMPPNYPMTQWGVGSRYGLTDIFRSLHYIAPQRSLAINIPAMVPPQIPGLVEPKDLRQVAPLQLVSENIPNQSVQNVPQPYMSQGQENRNGLIQAASTLQNSSSAQHITVPVRQLLPPGEMTKQNAAPDSIEKVSYDDRRAKILRRIELLKNQSHSHLTSNNTTTTNHKPAGSENKNNTTTTTTNNCNNNNHNNPESNENLKLLKSMLAEQKEAHDSAIALVDSPEKSRDMQPHKAPTQQQQQKTVVTSQVDTSHDPRPMNENLGDGVHASSAFGPVLSSSAHSQETLVNSADNAKANEVTITEEGTSPDSSRKRKHDTIDTCECPSCLKIFNAEEDLDKHWKSGECLKVKTQTELAEFCKKADFRGFLPLVKKLPPTGPKAKPLENPVPEEGSKKKRQKKSKNKNKEEKKVELLAPVPMSSDTEAENPGAVGRMTYLGIRCPARCGRFFPSGERIKKHISEDRCFKNKPWQWFSSLCISHPFRDELRRAYQQYEMEIGAERTKTTEDGNGQQSRMEIDVPNTKPVTTDPPQQNLNPNRGLFANALKKSNKGNTPPSQPEGVTQPDNGAIHGANAQKIDSSSSQNISNAFTTKSLLTASDKASADNGHSLNLSHTTHITIGNGGSQGSQSGAGFSPSNIAHSSNQPQSFTELARMHTQQNQTPSSSLFLAGNNQAEQQQQPPFNTFGNILSAPSSSSQFRLFPPNAQNTTSMISGNTARPAFGASYVPLSSKSLFDSDNTNKTPRNANASLPSSATNFTCINSSSTKSTNTSITTPLVPVEKEFKHINPATSFSAFTTGNKTNSAFSKEFQFSYKPAPTTTATTTTGTTPAQISSPA